MPGNYLIPPIMKKKKKQYSAFSKFRLILQSFPEKCGGNIN
jgi:hypothetical protein